MVVIYSQDGIKLYPLLLTACLKNDFGESIYVFSVCVTLTAKFSIPIENCRVLNGLIFCMISKGRLKKTVEFSTVILSYNRTREFLETLSSFWWSDKTSFNLAFFNITKTLLEIFVVILSAFAHFSEFFLDHC